MELEQNEIYHKPMSDAIKRFFDLFVSLIAIIVLSPFFILIALLIKIGSNGPVLFKQTRIGRNELPFEIYKFRTMVVDAEKLGTQITIGKDPRITKIGHFLRKTKLDELPQLFNVLKGEMSFVGPRPEVPKYTKLYSEQQRLVFTVRPGITDYASIKYRDENELLGNVKNPEKVYIEEIMPDKLHLNIEYIQRRSLLEDIKIIFLTVMKIIK